MSAKLMAAQDFCRELHRAIDRVPPYSMGDRMQEAARNVAFDKITALIEAKGGTVKTDWQGVSVRLFGIRASSTGGLLQACQNWKAQVTLKSMAANMAAQTGGAV